LFKIKNNYKEKYNMAQSKEIIQHGADPFLRRAEDKKLSVASKIGGLVKKGLLFPPKTIVNRALNIDVDDYLQLPYELIDHVALAAIRNDQPLEEKAHEFAETLDRSGFIGKRNVLGVAIMRPNSPSQRSFESEILDEEANHVVSAVRGLGRRAVRANRAIGVNVSRKPRSAEIEAIDLFEDTREFIDSNKPDPMLDTSILVVTDIETPQRMFELPPTLATSGGVAAMSSLEPKNHASWRRIAPPRQIVPAG
jgi:hypothetical protein